MTQQRLKFFSERKRRSGETDPFTRISTLTITASAVGGLLSIGLAVIAWIGIPEARVFIVAALVLGGLFGLALWWKHR